MSGRMRNCEVKLSRDKTSLVLLPSGTDNKIKIPLESPWAQRVITKMGSAPLVWTKLRVMQDEISNLRDVYGNQKGVR